MSTYELQELPLSIVLKQVRELIESGYDPKHYLSNFMIADSGARLRKS